MLNHPELARMPRVGVFRLQLNKPSEVFISEQACALTRYQPLLIGRDIYGPVPAGLARAAPPPVGRPARAWRALIGADAFYERSLRAFGARLVHAHFGVDAVAINAVARRMGLPLVTTFHGFDATTRTSRLLCSGSPSLVKYALGRSRLAAEGALFFCVSKFIRDKVLALGFASDRVVLHYLGTDVARFAGLQRQAPLARPVILHVARLVEKKGSTDLIAAFHLLRARCPEAELVIIGEGPLRAQLQAQVAHLQLESHVRFLGARPHAEVIAWMACARVFCLPSVTAANGDTEGLPISIIEAAAAGLPIVATRHSGIPEAVEHERGGLLVAEHAVGDLAEALASLLLNETQCERMGTEAQRYVRAHFDVRVQTAVLETLYDRVAQG